MNDEFLLRYRRTPRPEFADALYERISSQPQPRLAIPMLNRLTFRNVGAMLALMLFVAACVYVATGQGWHKVAGMWVNVQRTYKVDFSPISSTIEETEIQPPECFTVEEAKEILRFEFHVPDWAPDGFTFGARMCGIDRISDYASLYWNGPDKYTGISIYLTNLRWYDPTMLVYKVGPASVWGPVAPGSYKEVQVNGQPAILVRGDWETPWATEFMLEGEHEFKWDKKRAVQLYWVDGEVMYHLYTRAKVSPEDLIRMAESAR